MGTSRNVRPFWIWIRSVSCVILMTSPTIRFFSEGALKRTLVLWVLNCCMASVSVSIFFISRPIAFMDMTASLPMTTDKTLA